MDRRLTISVEGWLEGDSGSSEVRSTVAELEIFVGRYCATRVEDVKARSVRTTIRVSAFLFAAWLLDNWWRLRWEPVRHTEVSKEAIRDWRLSHALPAVGGGYVWPPLTIASDGENVLFALSQEAFLSDDSNITPIRYLNSFIQLIDVQEYERGVSAFVETVLARLDSSGNRRTVLHEVWKETLAERKSPAKRFARKLEALLGLDPDENPKLVEALRIAIHLHPPVEERELVAVREADSPA